MDQGLFLFYERWENKIVTYLSFSERIKFQFYNTTRKVRWKNNISCHFLSLLQFLDVNCDEIFGREIKREKKEKIVLVIPSSEAGRNKIRLIFVLE